MKFKEKSCVLEFVVHLLQKALLEDELDLVLQWEQNILNWLSRRVCVSFWVQYMFGMCSGVLSYISVILLDVTWQRNTRVHQKRSGKTSQPL